MITQYSDIAKELNFYNIYINIYLHVTLVCNELLRLEFVPGVYEVYTT